MQNVIKVWRLDNRIVSMLNVLGLIIVQCLYKRRNGLSLTKYMLKGQG